VGLRPRPSDPTFLVLYLLSSSPMGHLRCEYFLCLRLGNRCVPEFLRVLRSFEGDPARSTILPDYWVGCSVTSRSGWRAPGSSNPPMHPFSPRAPAPTAVTSAATSAPINFSRLINDLVGTGEDCRRDGKAERSRGIEIDGQPEFTGRLDRQFGGMRALGNLCKSRCPITVL
jgi:hypothetical protein